MKIIGSVAIFLLIIAFSFLLVVDRSESKETVWALSIDFAQENGQLYFNIIIEEELPNKGKFFTGLKRLVEDYSSDQEGKYYFSALWFNQGGEKPIELKAETPLSEILSLVNYLQEKEEDYESFIILNQYAY